MPIALQENPFSPILKVSYTRDFDPVKGFSQKSKKKSQMCGKCGDAQFRPPMAASGVYYLLTASHRLKRGKDVCCGNFQERHLRVGRR